jgi:hypothetical protein
MWTPMVRVDTGVIFRTSPAHHPATGFMGVFVQERDTGLAKGWMGKLPSIEHAHVLIEADGEQGRRPGLPSSFFSLHAPPGSPFPHIGTSRSESFDLSDGCSFITFTFRYVSAFLVSGRPTPYSWSPGSFIFFLCETKVYNSHKVTQLSNYVQLIWILGC